MITWQNNKGSVDASELGLRPGEWPEAMRVVDQNGIQRLFHIGTRETTTSEDTITLVRYGWCDSVLTVFND